MVLDFHNVGSTLNRAGVKKFSQFFNHFRDLEFPKRWKSILLRRRFFLRNDREKGISIIATSRNLQFLASCETVIRWNNPIMPAPLRAIIFFGANGRKIPLAFSSLSGKSTFIYHKMFDIIFRKIQKMGVTIQIVNIVTDNERDIISATEAIFPIGIFAVVTFTIAG